MAKKIGVIIEVNTSDVSKRLADVDFQLEQINQQLKEAKRLNQQDVYAGLKQQQAALRNEAQTLNKTLRDQQKTFDAAKFPKDSLIGLTNTYRNLRREIDSLSAAQRKSDFGQNLIRQAAGVKNQIDQIGASVGDFRSQVGRYKQSVIEALDQTGLVGGNIKALFAGGGIVAGVGLAISGVVKGAQALFNINKEISAVQASVQKTTGLTQAEVDTLTDSLKAIDTATTIEGLLEISAIAGQLGIKGVDGVEAFTASVDNLVVALGDDFGGGADVVTDQVGRLSNVLFGATNDGVLFAQRLTNLGNALNVLGASGSATAPVITDFANRIAALAGPLGVSQGTILGISATLQELGVTAERGGTAVGRIFQTLAGDADAFQSALEITPEILQSAGFQVNSFSELVNTDLTGALQFASSRILELSNSNVDLVARLKEVGIKSAGALEVFLKLGQANERLGENINTATDALTKQDSILSEVEARNESLAGASARLGNAFRELFVSSGVENFFADIVKAIIPVVNFLGKVLPQVFSRVGEIISPLFDAFKNLFGAIFGGSQDFSLLKKVGDLLVGTLVFVIDTVSDLVNGIANGIKAVREFIESNKILSTGFKILKDVITAPFTLLSKLPALLSGIGSAFRQLRDNIKSLDFSKSIGDAFKEGHDKAQIGSIELQKESEKTTKVVEENAKAFESGAISARDYSKSINNTSKAVDKLARGSIADLNSQLSELQKKLNEAPNASAFASISGQIDAVQQKIDETTAKFQRFRDAQAGLLQPLQTIGTTAQDPASGINQIIQTLDLENQTKISKEKEVQAALARLQEKALQESIKRRSDTFEEQLKQEEDFLNAQKAITQELTTNISDITAQFFSGEIKTFEDFLKSTVLAALDAAEKTLQIYAVEATAKQIATKGFVGVATGAILAALIKAGFATLKAGISSFATGGEVKTYSGEKIGQSQRISGYGRDTVLVRAFPGELIMNPEQQKRLKQLTGPGIFGALGIPGFQTGGLISSIPQIINPNTQAIQRNDQGVQIDNQVFQNQATIIASEVSRQVAEAVESGIFRAGERSDRRKQLMNDRKV